MSARRKFLKLPARLVDTSDMLQFALKELADHPECHALLSAYHRRQLAARREDPEHDGWLPRVQLPDLPGDESLSAVHGRLIALGLLTFELTDRTAGVFYQVTPLGLRALTAGPDDGADADELPQAA